jgi:hypothetical protein
MRTSQSKLVREALEREHCREVYGRRAPRSESARAVAPSLKPGDRVTRAGTVLSEARGLVWVRWDEGPKSCHLDAYLDTA